MQQHPPGIDEILEQAAKNHAVRLSQRHHTRRMKKHTIVKLSIPTAIALLLAWFIIHPSPVECVLGFGLFLGLVAFLKFEV